MRRSVLKSGVERVLNDLTESKVQAVFDEFLESLRHDSAKTFKPDLSIFRFLAVAFAGYGEAERELIKILELEDLYSPEFWMLLSQAKESGGPAPVFEVRGAVNSALRFLPRVMRLLRQDSVDSVLAGSQNLPDALRGQELFTVLIPENPNQYSSPKRISYTIDSVNDFYWIVATLLGRGAEDITVIACDSGSDKSFDFTGFPQVIQGVREIILSIWDRVVFHRHSIAKANIDLISHSLPVLERIKAMEAEGSLAPEMAAQLRMKAVSACGRFVEAGALIPEIEAQAVQSPRALLGPEQKLLAAPTSSHIPDPEQTTSGENQPGNDMDLQAVVRDLQRQLAEKQSVRTKRKPRSPRLKPR